MGSDDDPAHLSRLKLPADYAAAAEALASVASAIESLESSDERKALLRRRFRRAAALARTDPTKARQMLEDLSTQLDVTG